MKSIISILLFTSVLFSGYSQNQSLPISVGYYSPFGNQFGGKIGTSITLKSWEVEKEKHKAIRNVFISPQIGFFTRPNIHQNYLFNPEIGFKIGKENRKLYLASSLGLGYLLSPVVIGGSVHLGTGEFVKERELQSSFLPTINFEIGSKQWKNWGYYFKLFYGQKLSFQREGSGFFGFELGVQYHIHQKTENAK